MEKVIFFLGIQGVLPSPPLSGPTTKKKYVRLPIPTLKGQQYAPIKGNLTNLCFHFEEYIGMLKVVKGVVAIHPI